MTKMKTFVMAAVGAATVAMTGSVASAHDDRMHVRQVTHVITVSCYRGPWEQVIWDRPNPIFTDSLVSAGYTYSEAYAIADRVCRDQSGVGQREVLRATMSDLIRSAPPTR